MAGAGGAGRKPLRSILLAKVHLAAKELGLNEGDYRAVLRCQFGAESAKSLSDLQLDKLILHFESKGWRPKGRDGKPRPRRGGGGRPDIKPGTDPERAPLIDKIEALLAEKGRLQGRPAPWAYAEAILRTQGGGHYLNWASFDALLKVVQALACHVKRLKRRAAAGGAAS